uniref:Uncharacterized protein n=1 Tax=Picea glauca TaxID=3330 RepID=A0A101LY83_PICGL|nr:hypothetical protein ABT39_MTgene5678 [Picea glauca]
MQLIYSFCASSETDGFFDIASMCAGMPSGLFVNRWMPSAGQFVNRWR